MLIDTHTHLGDPVFDRDRNEVLERAAGAGVGAVILVGEDQTDARRNLELAAGNAMLKPAAGLYPAILDQAQAQELQAFIRKECQRLVPFILKYVSVIFPLCMLLMPPGTDDFPALYNGERSGKC